MTQNLGGPGLQLPLPQNLYPTELGALVAPYDYNQNVVDLPPGVAVQIPRGNWIVDIGRVSLLQWLDPVTGIYRIHPWTYSARGHLFQIQSDGFNFRIANLTGCPVSAIMASNGSGYPTNATVTSSAGGSLWQPIIGGAISISSITNAGSGYGVPPIVLIPAPPTPGVQATADASIVGGSVTAVTMRDVGGGYTVAPSVTGTANQPTVVILPHPADPNLLSGTIIKNASVATTLLGSGSIMACLCTNPGTSVSAAPTLTVSSTSGSGASIVALLMQTVTGGSIVNAGSSISGAVWQAFPAALSASQSVSTVFPNPHIDLSTFIPRLAFGTFATISGGSLGSVGTTSIGQVFDGGLFVGGNASIATLVTQQSASGATFSIPNVTAVFGAVNDIVWLQPC